MLHFRAQILAQRGGWVRGCVTLESNSLEEMWVVTVQKWAGGTLPV